MTLSKGDRLGHYEIVAPAGAVGMARCTRRVTHDSIIGLL
jgi:hypothetical protein